MRVFSKALKYMLLQIVILQSFLVPVEANTSSYRLNLRQRYQLFFNCCNNKSCRITTHISNVVHQNMSRRTGMRGWHGWKLSECQKKPRRDLRVHSKVQNNKSICEKLQNKVNSSQIIRTAKKKEHSPKAWLSQQRRSRSQARTTGQSAPASSSRLSYAQLQRKIPTRRMRKLTTTTQEETTTSTTTSSTTKTTTTTTPTTSTYTTISGKVFF